MHITAEWTIIVGIRRFFNMHAFNDTLPQNADNLRIKQK